MENFFENNDSEISGAKSMLPSDDTDKIFGAWVGAEFLNKDKIFNASNFFAFAPSAFLPFYWNIVRTNLNWYLGHVYGIHNQGIFSSRTGAKVCKMSASLTMAGSYRFEGGADEVNFLVAFGRERKLEKKLRSELPLLNAIGFALAKLDVKTDKHLDISFISGNNYFVQTDREGNVLAMYALLLGLTADLENKEEGYYLVEERYFKKVRGVLKPIQRYRVYKGPVIASSQVYSKQSECAKGIEFESLSKTMQFEIESAIGKEAINKEFILPFAGLGVEVILNSFTSTGMEQYKQFSDSTIADIHNALYELDWTKTIKNEHKYVSQDFVAMPEGTIPGERMRTSHGDAERAIALELSDRAGYNKRLVKSQFGGDPTKQVPFSFQPSLRTAEYNADLDHIYAEIASGAQFSPATLSNYLKGDAVKTATQVRVDEGATQTTIEGKRQLLVDGLNPLFKEVLSYYGLRDCAVLVFNSAGVSDKKGELEILEIKQRNGWISKRQAILEANPEYSKVESEKMYAEIKDEEAYASQSFADML